VRLTEPVVMVGHSFGGGVAIRTAHDRPDLVRSLVLVNSVGGSAWRKGKTLTSLAERPLWDWGLHFPGDIWPIPQATRVLPVMLEDALPNLVRNPRSLWKVANVARGADLTDELEELKRRELPVTILWASRDGIIPRESFEALCVAAGAHGRVVEGSHSWLLADPDGFTEVITNDLEVAKMARALEQTAAKGRRRARAVPDETPTLRA
jgi:pimeloyl-ACP methyl ester carboxylesterase